jgi:hypothetical protein
MIEPVEQAPQMLRPWEPGWTPELVKSVAILPKIRGKSLKAEGAQKTPVDPGSLPPDAKQGPDGRFLPGKSGNPAGRPRGIIDKRQRISDALAEDAQKIVDVVRNAALEGDMQAAGIVLARIAPPLKAAAEKVTFEFRTDVPLSAQAEAVMAAIAAGDVDPETGKSLIAALQNVAGIRAVEDLEQRIIQLEARQIG